MEVSRTRRATLVATTLVLGLLAGCAGQQTVSVPVQKSLDYELVTHCGIRWAHFDGRDWITPFLGDSRTRSAPEGWANPLQEVEMHLIADNLAVFVSDGHPPLIFRVTDRRPPQPGCA